MTHLNDAQVFEKKFEKLISYEEYFNRLFMKERTLFIK